MAGWTKCAARALRALADELHTDTDVPPQAPPLSYLAEDDDLHALVGDFALSLLDPHVHGFLIVKLVQGDDGDAQLVNEHMMPRQAWPAVALYLERVQRQLVGQ